MYSSQTSAAHLPHPVIAYSWNTARNLVAYPVISYDGFVTTQEMLHSVIPAEAGIQFFRTVAERLDPGIRRGDECL
jgi:hypothetical protein